VLCPVAINVGRRDPHSAAKHRVVGVKGPNERAGIEVQVHPRFSAGALADGKSRRGNRANNARKYAGRNKTIFQARHAQCEGIHWKGDHRNALPDSSWLAGKITTHTVALRRIYFDAGNLRSHSARAPRRLSTMSEWRNAIFRRSPISVSRSKSNSTSRS